MRTILASSTAQDILEEARRGRRRRIRTCRCPGVLSADVRASLPNCVTI